MYRITSIIVVLFMLIITMPQINKAQVENNATSQMEELRKKVAEQDAQINRMEQLIQRQSTMIEQQSKTLNSLEQKFDQSKTAPAPAPAPAVSAEKAPAAKPVRNVEIGIGSIRFNGLLQGQYLAGNESVRDSFRIRRAELKFTGEINPQVKWTFMIDLAKAISVSNTFATINGQSVLTNTSVNQSSRIFQDGYITLNYIKNVSVDIGQFKLPLSFEGVQSATRLETIERAMFLSDRARGGGLGDVRDIGVMARGSFKKQLEYQIGMFNGVGESHNDVDKNDQKTVVGRMVLKPAFVKGLQFGGSGAFTGATRIDRPRKERLGAELYYIRGPWTVKSELMTGKDADLHRIGYYGLLAYKINPKVEAVFRYDTFDPDRRRENSFANAIERDYVVGVNYFISENNVKLQFNYLRKTFNNDIVPARNLFLINLQTAW
jgi:phosphate-selective porin/uncharacterized coiled-coil protein SlyX